MNIHTTQNLDFLSTNKYNAHSMYAENSGYAMTGHRLQAKSDSVSFKGKKELVKVTEEVLSKLKTAGNESKWYDKILTSGFFDKTLDMMSHEVFVQAAISAIICCALRPLTIMALPSKDKSKNDNMYAASHSISSGLLGLASSLLISIPFSKGIKYAQKNLLQTLKPEILEKMFPNLNIESIWEDKAKGLRKPMDKWLDKVGNTFSTEYKNVMKVAKPKPIAAVSEETMKTFGATKNDISKMDAKDLFVKISEEGMGENFFSLGYIDEKFLKETIPDIDIKSIKKNGKVLNPMEWKTVSGDSAADILKDNLYVSSYRETCESVPLYTGRVRTESSGKKETKYTGYQRNVEGGLGTEISQKMLDADHANDIKYKLLGWMPDIISRPFVAAGTIAILPVVLKNVFHLEKSKKPAEPQALEQKKVVA